ncbi:sulfotransferase [Candidatus Borrarchaeum sp.]|uniref:sulfotransferase family protein n=1 Tax=Candidatus Borrarchaeum sp. TaxID=2846742 RepID=UPI00257E82BF|nr:sulfotransferase [Candidatus Borrarchaeum sp.]
MSDNNSVYHKLGDFRLALNQIFEQRDRLFPKRDLKNTIATREILTAYTNTLKSIKERNLDINNKLTESVKEITDKCVFICGCMKSGTSLLLELLDGHPELIVMPGDSHMINLINKHYNLPLSKRLEGWDTYWTSRLINPTGQKPFWILGEHNIPYLNFLYYLDYWLEYLPLSDRASFLAVVLAFYCANPKRPANPKLWVEKTPGNEMKTDQIKNLFPAAHFIHIIRDPRPNIASLKRLCKLRKWNWNALNYVKMIQNSIEAGFQNQERFGKEKYHILRYEDLVTNPVTQMKNIARFLEISMDEILLHPTVNSLPAKSNTMFEERQIQGKILMALSNRWRTELDSFEQRLISGILYPAAKRLGYYYDWNFGPISHVYYLCYYYEHFRKLIYRMFKLIRKLK